jgi:hypothetical protein
MRAPELRATIERRLLVNYRIDAEVLAANLPAPFRPAEVAGYGIGGICLIRVSDVRPVGASRFFDLTSENAAHRLAVEWDTPSGTVRGVYIPRRDTSSRISALAGGRLFPGWQHRAHFDVHEGHGNYEIHVHSHDGLVTVDVDARRTDEPMAGSIFRTVEAASTFFRSAPVGYAATPCEGVFDGVELGTDSWNIAPLQLERVASSFFDDRTRFPSETVTLDSAFLMSGITTRWRPQSQLVAAAPAEIEAATSAPPGAGVCRPGYPSPTI